MGEYTSSSMEGGVGFVPPYDITKYKSASRERGQGGNEVSP